MSFPQNLDPAALRQLVRLVTAQDTDKGRAALAIYDLTGYGLGQLFPNAAYLADMSQTDPATVAFANHLTTLDNQQLKDMLAQLVTVVGPIAINFILNWLKK